MPLTMNKEVFITCAVTGSGGTQDRSPHVPRSPKDIAESAIAAGKAGASGAAAKAKKYDTAPASPKHTQLHELWWCIIPHQQPLSHDSLLACVSSNPQAITGGDHRNRYTLVKGQRALCDRVEQSMRKAGVLGERSVTPLALAAIATEEGAGEQASHQDFTGLRTSTAAEVACDTQHATVCHSRFRPVLHCRDYSEGLQGNCCPTWVHASDERGLLPSGWTPHQ